MKNKLTLYNVMKRSYMSNVVRKSLYVRCLNREFDSVLAEVRKIPTNEMDYNFLQLYLQRSCQWGHTESVDYIWYKYVIRNEVLFIRPNILCEMSNIALYGGKNFMPDAICKYYRKIYRYLQAENPVEYLKWEYELLRIKIESFARSTGEKTRFREKWKVFLEDMDNHLPNRQRDDNSLIYPQFHVRDFPNLVESYGREYVEFGSTMTEFLFEEKLIRIKNKKTLPLLLNVILVQGAISFEFKWSLFKQFFNQHKSLPMADSLQIMIHNCKNDSYALKQLKNYCGDEMFEEVVNRKRSL